VEAQALAARLMVDLTGATLVPGTIDEHGDLPPAATIHLRTAQVGRLVGRDVARAEQARILEALGFAVADAGDGLDVIVPHFRAGDVTREADLVEEVARIDGFENLPDTLPSRNGAVGVLAPEQRLRRRAEDALTGAGLYEVVGWSFTSTAAQARLGASIEPVRLRNPMSEEQAVMRTHVLTSLLDAAETNARRGMPDVRLFEIGSVYLPWDPDRPRPPSRWDPPSGTRGAQAWADGVLPDERTHVAVLLRGPVRGPSWNDAPSRSDFFAAKAVLEGLARSLRSAVTVEPATEPFLHPGRSARVFSREQPIGWIGELHPALAGEGASAFEVDLGVLINHADAVPVYRDLTSYPALRQDLAVTLGDDVPAAAVLETVRQAGGKLLVDVSVFDVYRGEQVGAGRHSLALRLTFRAPDRTLTDEDVKPAREKIVSRLREDLGGDLRD
jgi:phenylalanyl-tRNA synthetase beta chain